MPDEVFGELVSFTDVEHLVLAHYKTWMNTWLAARERHIGKAVGAIARPRSYIVKQTFTALPGEEQTPIVIAVSDGFAIEPQRRGTGSYDALFRFGIAVVCMGKESTSARDLCGHYQTAIFGIALRHRAIKNGLIHFHQLVNLRIDDIPDEDLGRSIASVRLEAIYKVDNFAAERPVPALLPDVVPPQPDAPLVEEVIVNVNRYQADEVLP